MADEEAPPAPGGEEAAPEAAAEEETPTEAPDESPSEAPYDEAPAVEEALVEDGAPAEGPAGEGVEGVTEPTEEEAALPAEGEGESPEGEELGAPVEGEELLAEGGELIEEARPPSEVGLQDEIRSSPSREAPRRDESGVAVKIAPSSRIAIEGKQSASVLEEQRRARLEKYGSRAKVALGSVIDIRRGSVAGDVADRRVARFLNTYKLDSDNPFNPEKVNKILETVMMEALENLTYDTDKCPKQAKWATSAIRAKVKELEFDRYKIICLVSIGEKNGQDVLVTCRFLWDYERDRYATFSMENTYVYGIAQCFGLYYE